MSHSRIELRTPPSIGRATRKVSPSSKVLALIAEPSGRMTSRPEENVHVQAQLAKTLYRARRDRDKLFPSNIFADPAWDILLILYSADLAQQRLNITSVCTATAVPTTTALRWIDNLVGHGLLRKEQHVTDGRTTWLELTADARARLDRFFDGMLAQSPASNSTALRPSCQSPNV